MAQTIELPHVGESVVEGTIGKWLKKPGDRIERYEPLVEVVTDKVTMEVPSPVDGSLLKILAEEGQTIPMGAPIAEVETEGGPAPAEAAEVPPAAAEVPAASAAAPAPPAEPVADPAEAPSVSRIGYLNTSATMIGPTGGGAGDESPPAPPPEPAAALAASLAAQVAIETPMVTAPGRDGRTRLSPAVRRLAREHDVDLSLITGTGMGGRITRDDVLKYLDTKDLAPAVVATQPQPSDSGDEEYLPLTPVRRMIAEAMVRSVSQIPHAWSTVEVDVTSLVAARTAMRESFRQREGVDLTYLPFVLRALVETLKENPTFNATWGEDKIVLKKRLNIGLAVAAPNGLVVPVIHNADRLSLSGLAHAVADLAQRARDNKLTIDDVQGGTFTLNNTGALGSVVSQPIINYPQAAIMTTEAVQKRPVVINDAIAIRSMMNLCMSFDHRINDGAESSAFMQSMKRRLEEIGPDSAW
ncbi:MAG: dihydrolipoamide acetyltransferase family protein [Chloroflexi bacterium]|nr:dihydrolipoamide acetyltransferase family protein [Chloroflexota bacterium]